MHYYQFNIGDYASATAHLEPLEDLAYRRLLDLYYSTEKPIQLDLKQVARIIRMRTHSECITSVLEEFFTLEDDGWHCDRVDVEIFKYTEKSFKASKSAKTRWKKDKQKQKVKASCERIANAEETQCEGNANQEPLTINQEPLTITKKTLVKPAAKPSKYKFTQYQMDFAKWMHSLILKVNPTFADPNLDDWANTLRLMMAVNNRDGDHMVKVFAWANGDSFWSSNIQSPTKFRKQFDALTAKMNGSANKTQSTERTQEEVDQFTEELNDQYERSQAAKARREARSVNL
jgi:uncharacterized protein YdaU (DUF1376 family)